MQDDLSRTVKFGRMQISEFEKPRSVTDRWTNDDDIMYTSLEYILYTLQNVGYRLYDLRYV